MSTWPPCQETILSSWWQKKCFQMCLPMGPSMGPPCQGTHRQCDLLLLLWPLQEKRSGSSCCTHRRCLEVSCKSLLSEQLADGSRQAQPPGPY